MGLCPDRFCRGVGRGAGGYDPEFSGKEAEAGKVGREKKDALEVREVFFRFGRFFPFWKGFVVRFCRVE